MDISFFLAKALGLYMLIIGISLLINKDTLYAVMKDITQQPAVFYLSAVIALIIGILMVVSHNLWAFNWRIIITLMGWTAFIKGTFNILFPQRAYKLVEQFSNHKSAYLISTIVTLVIGLLLAYCGFFLE